MKKKLKQEANQLKAVRVINGKISAHSDLHFKGKSSLQSYLDQSSYGDQSHSLAVHDFHVDES